MPLVHSWLKRNIWEGLKWRKVWISPLSSFEKLCTVYAWGGFRFVSSVGSRQSSHITSCVGFSTNWRPSMLWGNHLCHGFRVKHFTGIILLSFSKYGKAGGVARSKNMVDREVGGKFPLWGTFLGPKFAIFGANFPNFFFVAKILLLSSFF